MQTSNNTSLFPYRIRTLTKYTNMKINHTPTSLNHEPSKKVNMDVCDANIIATHRALAGFFNL